jgi:hypothetical protein
VAGLKRSVAGLSPAWPLPSATLYWRRNFKYEIVLAGIVSLPASPDEWKEGRIVKVYSRFSLPVSARLRSLTSALFQLRSFQLR